MHLISKLNINHKKFFSLIIALVPLSFIAGNMIININIVLIILTSLLFFGRELFKIEFFLLDKLLLAFFILILITGIINNFQLLPVIQTWVPDFDVNQYFPTIIKSILFIKYILLYFVLRFLIEKDLIDLKYFFLISAITSLFVCIDIFFQFLNGKDIFGYPATGRKLSGPFGDELIAGGFIQRFSLFTFFLIPLFFKNILNKYIIIIIPILFLIIFTGIILSGNRMPLILFIFCISLILLFQKQTRKFLIPFVIIFSLAFFLIFSSNKLVRDNFLNFYGQTSQMLSIIINKDFNDVSSPLYFKEFYTFYDTWLMNKYIGGGIKNFRYFCHERENLKKDQDFKCNMHPHNYYLEILTETGLIGFIIILLAFVNIIGITFYRKYFTNSFLKDNNLIIPFMFLFFVEIFPIKSTGSFFTTGNSTYLFLIMGILIGLVRREISFKNNV
tara:strand:+ start:1498 stop:2832 length:1335 start_codon:yes stop_codon:yes gene_type:complete